MLPPASSCKVFLIPLNAGSRALWLYLKEAKIPFVLERVKAEDAVAKCFELYHTYDQIPGSLCLPFMRDQTTIIFGNSTILRYLATKYSHLYPNDIAKRAAVDMFLEWHSNHLHKASSDLLENTTPAAPGIFSVSPTIAPPRPSLVASSSEDPSLSVPRPDSSNPFPGGSSSTFSPSSQFGPAPVPLSLSTSFSSPVAASSSSSSSSSSPPAPALPSTPVPSSGVAEDEVSRQEAVSANALERARKADVAFRQTLEVLENNFLSESKWLASQDAPTIADLVAACELAFIELTRVRLVDYFPKVHDWFERVKAAFSCWGYVHQDLASWIPDALRRQEEQTKKLQNIKKHGKDATGGLRVPDISHRVRFPFSLTDAYKMFLDSEQLTRRLGKPCTVEAKKGGAVSLNDGEYSGTILVLVENTSILIGWRANEWGPNDRSMTTIAFSAVDAVLTEVTLSQADVPQVFLKKMDDWWNANFWIPLEGVLVRDASSTIFFENATPHFLYENLMDVARMTRYTRTKCELNRGVGADFSLLDGIVTGKNIELITDKKISQLWRCSEWPAQHHSTISIELKRVPGGTDLTFTQTNIPVLFYEKTNDCWDKQFWRKIRKEAS